VTAFARASHLLKLISQRAQASGPGDGGTPGLLSFLPLRVRRLIFRSLTLGADLNASATWRIPRCRTFRKHITWKFCGTLFPIASAASHMKSRWWWPYTSTKVFSLMAMGYSASKTSRKSALWELIQFVGKLLLYH